MPSLVLGVYAQGEGLGQVIKKLKNMTKDLTFKESWFKAMQHLPLPEQKKVTMAILHYAFADEDWEKVLRPQSRAVFLLIKADYHMQEKLA